MADTALPCRGGSDRSVDYSCELYLGSPLIRQGAPNLRITVVRPRELGQEEIALWHSMQQETTCLTNPFLAPEFAVAVDKFRSDARLAILIDGSEIVGFFPFQKRRLGVGVPIGSGLSDCQGVVHAPHVEWDARELLRACGISFWQFDHLVQGQRPFENYVSSVQPSPVIDLSDGFETYQKRLRCSSPKFCKGVEVNTRKLERDVGPLRFVIDSSNESGLHALMKWKSEKYRRTGTADRFNRPWIVSLVECLFSAKYEWCRGMLSLMYAGESLIAAHFDLRAGAVLAGWFAAYDPHFGRRSPGLIQHVGMAAHVPEIGVRLIDLGKGSEPYKQSLKSRDLLVCEGMVTRGSLTASGHRACEAMSQFSMRQIRRHPSLFRLAGSLLRRYGRTG
jgi:CelD/BcsL family acetyltransferase involved in cellulose biosynthesis